MQRWHDRGQGVAARHPFGGGGGGNVRGPHPRGAGQIAVKRFNNGSDLGIFINFTFVQPHGFLHMKWFCVTHQKDMLVLGCTAVGIFAGQ